MTNKREARRHASTGDRSANSAASKRKPNANGGRKKGAVESLIGDRFNMLRVISYAGRVPGGRNSTWNCVCDCGAKTIAVGSRLKNGSVKSCGCFKRTHLGNTRLTHGHAAKGVLSPEYRTWRAVRRRCENPNDVGYPHYGGRGIKLCDKWKSSFEAFLADVGPKPTDKHSIGRINNDGDYEPGNVRWETPIDQGSNTSRSRHFTINGRTMCLSAWVREYGLHPNTVRRRLNRGLCIEAALGIEVSP